MIPVTDHDAALMQRENPELQFTINVLPTGYQITIKGNADTYSLHTMRGSVRVFARGDSVFKWLQLIGATNIDVHMCPDLETHSIC